MFCFVVVDVDVFRDTKLYQRKLSNDSKQDLNPGFR